MCNNIFLNVVTPIVVSLGIALVWVRVLDPDWDGLEHKIDLTALNQLNLIIGFLYINTIQDALQKWKKLTSKLNAFAVDAATLVSYDREFEPSIKKLYSLLEKLLQPPSMFYAKTTVRKLDFLKDIIAHNIKLIKLASTKDTITKQLAGSIKQCVEQLDRDYFEKEPDLFRYHLRALLFLYFASVPVQLFNSYGYYMLLIYPIMIYLLFAVVLWSNAFHSPLDHPELQPRFQRLQQRFQNVVSMPPANQLWIPYKDKQLKEFRI
jgi:hypothetical protein